MQFDEAMRRRKAWGDKPCNHPKTEKEYYLGAATGDYVCTTCGGTWPSRLAAQQDQVSRSHDDPITSPGRDSHRW